MEHYEKYVSKEDTQKIHENTIKILSEIGVRFEHPKVIDVFKKNGLKTDGYTVFFSDKNLQDALKSVPSTFIIQNSKGCITFGNGSLILMPGVGSIYLLKNGYINKMSNDDAIDLFKISDTSDVIDCNYFNVFLEDKELTLKQRIYSPIAMVLKYSHKPGLHLMANTFPLNHTISMAYREGIELINKFEGRHGVYNNIVHINSLSPLCYDHDPLEKLLITSEMNQPLWFSPCAMPLLTGPPSVAGLISMTNAEVLSAIVLSQLLRPGIPVVYGNTSASTNLREIQLSIGAPETALISYGTSALANYYKVPFRTGGGLSDAKDFDPQLGYESDLMIRSTLEAKPDLVLHACGIMGSFNIVSLEKFLLDEETYRMNKRLLLGIKVDDETLCFDRIKKIGPRGNFLTGKTPQLFKKEFFVPKYFDKEDPNQWQRKGNPRSIQKLSVEVIKRLESYKIPEITKEQEKLLEPYIPDKYKTTI